MVELADWRGELAGRRMDDARVTARAPMPKRPAGGGSRPLLVLADDGRQYWLKPINNPQRPIIPVVEQIVGRCGALIGAPVRPVEIVVIPEDLAGFEIYPGYVLATGIAHGSLHLDAAQLAWGLEHAERNENRSRYLEIVALYDWCQGDDPQWLYQTGANADYEYYSHDHGEYLLSRGEWTLDAIMTVVDEPRILAPPLSASSLSGFTELADRIASITREHLIEVLSAIPSSWPVSDTQLELLGFFLERRRDAVVTRVQERYLHHWT